MDRVPWLRAFLSDRRGRVRVGDMVSALREFVEGFPQGTVLGPVLWDLFADDIVDALRSLLPANAQVEVVLYADDVMIAAPAADLLRVAPLAAAAA